MRLAERDVTRPCLHQSADGLAEVDTALRCWLVRREIGVQENGDNGKCLVLDIEAVNVGIGVADMLIIAHTAKRGYVKALVA